jgi:hypothetical protein
MPIDRPTLGSAVLERDPHGDTRLAPLAFLVAGPLSDRMRRLYLILTFIAVTAVTFALLVAIQRLIGYAWVTYGPPT